MYYIHNCFEIVTDPSCRSGGQIVADSISNTMCCRHLYSYPQSLVNESPTPWAFQPSGFFYRSLPDSSLLIV
jgi:hypothetical protein